LFNSARSLENLIAEIYTGVADVDFRSSDEFADFKFRFSAEGAA
jgi:hypothetical protein